MDNSKQIADLLDEAAEVFTKLSACFRGAGSGGEKPAGDGKAARKVRGKPAATEDDAITVDTVREKLKEVADQKGAAAMKAVLTSVGASRLSDVEEDQYEELMAAAEKTLATKGKAKTKGVDFDELTTRFKKLVDEDSAKAKAVLKAAGLKKLSEADQDDQEVLKELSDAVDAALEGDEDDSLV